MAHATIGRGGGRRVVACGRGALYTPRVDGATPLKDDATIGPPTGSRRPFPVELHDEQFVFPGNYTQGCGPRKGAVLGFDSPGLAFLRVGVIRVSDGAFISARSLL